VSAYIDAKSPVVLSVTPTGTKVNPANQNSVWAHFSEQIDMNTVTAATFTVLTTGSAVPGNFYSSSMYPNVPGVVFNPESPLKQATTYTVALSTGVKDLAGNPLQLPYIWSFTTTIPAPANLTATRSGQQVTLNWLPVTGATGYNVYWSTSYPVSKLNGTKIGTITGTSYTHAGLANGTTYYYVVTALAGAVEGVESNQQSVLIDNVPPIVATTSPTGNATGVDVSGPVCFSFSKQLDMSTWNSLNVVVKDATGALVSGAFYQVGTATCLGPGFTPSSSFAFNTKYIVTVGAVRDQVGNPLAVPFSLSFTTAPATPTGLSASAGVLQTSLSWTPVSGATSYNIYWANAPNITPGNSQKITGVTTVFYLQSNLANGSIYYSRVSAVTSGGESGLSNEVKAVFDTTPPVVASTSPIAGPGAYPPSYLISNFNETIDPASVLPTALAERRERGDCFRVKYFVGQWRLVLDHRRGAPLLRHHLHRQHQRSQGPGRQRHGPLLLDLHHPAAGYSPCYRYCRDGRQQADHFKLAGSGFCEYL